jgi:membrane protease YdiL (CAAX protease family)
MPGGVECTGSPEAKMDTATAANRLAIVFAYAGLVISVPVYGFWQAFLAGDTTTLLLIQSGSLAALLALAFVWRAIRVLRGFFLIALTMSLLPAVMRSAVIDSAVGARLFGGRHFLMSQSGELSSKLIATLVMIGVLLLMGLKRRDFFLIEGDLNAVSKPSRWLPGMKTDERWRRTGRKLSIGVFVLLLSGTLLINLPRLGIHNLVKAVPLLPAALLFAAANSIYEEVVFRAAPLSQLVNTVGSRHAFLITIVYFGLGHYSGSVPSGVIGVALGAYFAFLMGKAMLETQGIVWPWVCHFAADSAVFISMAVSAVAAGTT